MVAAKPTHLQVRITESVRYCPANGEAQTLVPSSDADNPLIVEMPSEDAYNIVAAGRGVVVNDPE